MFESIRKVVASALENAAADVYPEPKVLPWPWGVGFITTALGGIAIGLTRSKVEHLEQEIVALRKATNETISATRKRLDELGGEVEVALNAANKRIDAIVHGKAEVIDASQASVSGTDAPAKLDRLAELLDRHYAGEQGPVDDPIEMAIKLLTPGDGSDEAWRQMRAEGQRALVAMVAAAKSPEVELGQCRASPVGKVMRVDAKTPDGKFVPTFVVGAPPIGWSAGWPMPADDIRGEFPIVLAGKVVSASAANGP